MHLNALRTAQLFAGYDAVVDQLQRGLAALGFDVRTVGGSFNGEWDGPTKMAAQEFEQGLGVDAPADADTGPAQYLPLVNRELQKQGLNVAASSSMPWWLIGGAVLGAALILRRKS